MIEFDHPAWGLALPLALLPLLRGIHDQAAVHPWLAVVPRDLVSSWVDALLRAIAALAIASIVAALAGPHRGEQRIERIGKGAEIAIVLDRSRSMDESYTRQRWAGGYVDNGVAEESKASAARRIVSAFVKERSSDAFSMVLFSSYPIAMLPFTQQQDVVLASLAATAIGKGLGNTDIGRAMLAGAANFDDRPYLGSRAILLITDGGAQLDTDTKQRLASALRRNKVGVYWIYLRGANDRPLVLDGSLSEAEVDGLAEQSLHRYFSTLGLPYRVYDAERPESLQNAIDDLGRIEQRPIQYDELVPREDLAPSAIGIALAALALVLLSRFAVGGRLA